MNTHLYIYMYIYIHLHVHIIHWNILWYLFRNSSHTSWGKDSKNKLFIQLLSRRSCSSPWVVFWGTRWASWIVTWRFYIGHCGWFYWIGSMVTCSFDRGCEFCFTWMLLDLSFVKGSLTKREVLAEWWTTLRLKDEHFSHDMVDFDDAIHRYDYHSMMIWVDNPGWSIDSIDLAVPGILIFWTSKARERCAGEGWDWCVNLYEQPNRFETRFKVPKQTFDVWRILAGSWQRQGIHSAYGPELPPALTCKLCVFGWCVRWQDRAAEESWLRFSTR